MPTARFLTTATLIGLMSSSAFAATTWDAVKKKVTSCKDYEVSYRYDGPKGNFKFDYRCILPGKIRVEILESKSDSSKVGTIIVYDQAKNKDKVTYKTGGGVMTRNTTHKDVEGTPFYQPVFNLILDQTKAGGAPTVKDEGGRTRFDFKTGSGRYSVWANDAGDIVKTERTDSKETETREFQAVKYNCNPHVDF